MTNIKIEIGGGAEVHIHHDGKVEVCENQPARMVERLDKGKVNDCIHALYGAFRWETTKQGYEYWRSVRQALGEMLQE